MEKRITVSLYIVIGIFLIFSFRLWDLQIVKGAEFKKIAESNRLRIIEISAPRGLIFDNNDNALVRNIPSFDISVIKEDLPEDYETVSALAGLIGLEYKDLQARLEKPSLNPFEPVKLKQNVSMEIVARVEARKMDFPGIQVDVVIGREYIYDELAGHAIGYLGKLTLEQTRDPYYRGVPAGAYAGHHGIEKVYDKTLRGLAGKKIIEVDAIGRVIKAVGIQPPVKGSDIVLTIDMSLQSEAEDALKGKVGSVVVLDVDTGEILAMASSPSFDPNLFSRGIGHGDWDRLIHDPNKPFLNRSLQSQYPPGSTFKIITAIAALEEGIINDKTRFQCEGSIKMGRTFRCWKKGGHGSVNLYKAIVESCDVYFYKVANTLGIDTLAQYAADYGLGLPTGIELEGERLGIVPSSAWKLSTKKQKWYKGETLNTVIGQGYLSATPIQMARLMAAVVNGGKLLRPRILKNRDLNGIVEREIDAKPEQIEILKKALAGVVTDKNGTGWMARSEIVSIGGKTGTTQVIGGDLQKKNMPDKYNDHAWFVAFAPVENPRIAIAVFVEHGGHGSTAAVPIAKRVIEKYFEKDQNAKIKM